MKSVSGRKEMPDSRKLMNDDGDNIMSNKKQSEYTISRNVEPFLNPPG